MKNLRRLIVGVRVTLATAAGAVVAPAAVAAPPGEECDFREVFLAADGRTEVPYFERHVQLDGDQWVVQQQIGNNIKASRQLRLPAGLYEFQNIINHSAMIDPGDPLSPLGYVLRTQIYTANTSHPPVFETVQNLWDLNGQPDGVRKVGSCLWPD
jgi:hypothetical protein